MKTSTAVRESVRSVLRRPPLIALEIAWRWTLGVSCSMLAWAIVRAAWRRVSDNDMLEFRSMNSDRISATTAHLFEENGPYFFLLTILLLLGLALLWTLFAGAGRALTLRRITGRSIRVFNVALAQAFRAGVTVFCVLFFFGTLYLAAYLSTTSEGEVHVALYAVLSLLDMFAFALLWVTGNWVFWLASITSGVHDRFFGAKPSIFSEARRLARDKEHLDLEIAFGMLRTALFLIVFVVSLLPTVMLLRGGGVLLSVLLSLLTLTYLAAADVLQIARVTAIVNLAASGTKHQTSAPAMS